MKGIGGLKELWGTAKSILPIVIFLLLFQIIVLKKPSEEMKTILLGVCLSIIGLHLFLKGVNIGLLPLGDSAGKNLSLLDNKLSVVVFAFIFGYMATLVEPALKILALEVEEISVGAIPSNVLIHTVAIGFGAGMCLGILKILFSIPTKKIVVPLLIISVVLCFFVPEQFVDIAMDSASSTTGPVNIPLNMAIAIGLSSILENSDPLLNGFGIVGLTSLGTVVAVLILGILSNL